jgi:L-iditol 2-dehydrogenase
VIAAVPCGECHECDRGWMAVCENQTSVGCKYDGSFAGYLIVPRQVVKVDGFNRIPDNIGFDEASVAEPFACAINARELINVGDGDTVVVFGAGPIGCLHIRLARANGASRVFRIDVLADRLAMSADAVKPDEVINGRDVDVTEHAKGLIDGRGQRGAGAGDPDGRAARTDLLLRRAAENQPVQPVRLEPGALPRADDHGRQRLGPSHNKRALEYISRRPGPGEGPHHGPPALGARALKAFDIVAMGEVIKVTIAP